MDYGNLIQQFASSHQQLVEGVFVGAVLSNPGTCAILLFKAVLLIPGMGPWIARNPDKAKAWSDGFDKAIDEAVDKYAKAEQPAPTPKA